MSDISVLRAVTNRLNSIPIEDLPCQVGYLATSISSCRGLLLNGVASSDSGPLLHKLKTRVSALLQDRTPEGRFCGIVIAKAIVEAGGPTILSESGNWVRAIVSCLNKPDSAEVKKLGVLVVAHIYLLTAENQQFVREITTPTLPAFISATLRIIRPSTTTVENRTFRALSPLLEVVLRTWHALLEHFSSTIRPSSSSIRSICLSLVSDEACTKNTTEAAREVLAKLHYCAPKNTTGIEWSQSCSQIIEAAHETADLAFRAVVEDWTPATARVSKVTKKQKSATTPSTNNVDSAGLDAWSGVTQGCSRIQSHLDLLQSFLTNPNSSQINVPLGVLFDLTSRLSAITVPSSNFTPRSNSDITREEREELWLNLPRIHSSILQLYHGMILTFVQALYPVCNVIATHIWDIFEAEQEHEAIRAATYQLIASMLETRLLRLSKADSASFRMLVRRCCDDLRPTNPTSAGQVSLTNGDSGATTSNNNDKKTIDLTQSKQRQVSAVYIRTELHPYAYALIPALLTYADLHVLEGSSTIRAQLDSTAIVLNHREAILASVLHPSNSSAIGKRGTTKAATPSLVPFLARSMDVGGGANMTSTERLGFEAMLRPRMPVVHTTLDTTLDILDDEEQDEEAAADEADVVMLDQDTLLNQHNVDNSTEIYKTPTPSHDPKSTSDPSGNLIYQPNIIKRDFTTLLEQSANEQLAASAGEDTANASPLPNQETSSNKRAKTTGDNNNDIAPITLQRAEPDDNLPVTPDLSTTTASNMQQHLSLPSTTTIETATIETMKPASTLPSSSSAPQQALASLSETTQRNNDEDDDSSDSEIPLIDATLVGFSDSEDDEDIEETRKQ